ncbi:MAG: hypothetical protein WAL92_08370 [Thiogranum sp.]
MSKISTAEECRKAFGSLSLAQQRQVGARFVGNVLDLTDDPQVKNGQEIAGKVGVTADELNDAYHRVHAVYLATHPRSGCTELDYKQHAAHCVAEACMICLSPIYPERNTAQIVGRVAMYCQLARHFSAIQQQEGYPKFDGVEEAVKKEVDSQYKILSKYLEEG